MGSSSPRSNIPTTGLSGQVSVGDGGLAFQCYVDDTFDAEVLEASLTEVGALRCANDVLELVVAGGVAARLRDTAASRCLGSCMNRGYRYEGTVVGARSVRVRSVE